ncbi:MAG: hypothetical protein M0018_00885 [Nitrospiraceae bacterium]|nr:hypothetical protein [Nitrospiraceae bacterium]
MKTFSATIAGLLILTGLAFAGVLTAPTIPVDQSQQLHNGTWLRLPTAVPPSGSITMGPFNAAGQTSAPAMDMGFPVGYGKCTFTQVNGAATRVFILQGSSVSNSSGFTNDISHTVSADQTTWGFFFSGDPNRWWQGRCDSGCGVGNEITVQCTFGGIGQ